MPINSKVIFQIWLNNILKTLHWKKSSIFCDVRPQTLGSSQDHLSDVLFHSFLATNPTDLDWFLLFLSFASLSFVKVLFLDVLTAKWDSLSNLFFLDASKVRQKTPLFFRLLLITVEKHMSIVKMINMNKFHSLELWNTNCAGLQLQILPVSEMIILVAITFYLGFLYLEVTLIMLLS